MGVPVLSLNGGQGSAVQKSLAAAACVALAAAGKLKVVENICICMYTSREHFAFVCFESMFQYFLSCRGEDVFVVGLM